MLWWFFETSLVAGLLAMAAAICSRMPAVSPAARHLLWLVVLVKLIMPPWILFPLVLPSPPALWPEVQARAVTAPAAEDQPATPDPHTWTRYKPRGPDQDSPGLDDLGCIGRNEFFQFVDST